MCVKGMYDSGNSVTGTEQVSLRIAVRVAVGGPPVAEVPRERQPALRDKQLVGLCDAVVDVELRIGHAAPDGDGERDLPRVARQLDARPERKRVGDVAADEPVADAVPRIGRIDGGAEHGVVLARVARHGLRAGVVRDTIHEDRVREVGAGADASARTQRGLNLANDTHILSAFPVCSPVNIILIMIHSRQSLFQPPLPRQRPRAGKIRAVAEPKAMGKSKRKSSAALCRVSVGSLA
jgi:hypothetical protein